MKKFTRLSVLSVLMSVLAFISCDTEPVDPVLLDNIGQEPGAGPAVFKVDFSGSTYVATASAASAANGAIAITGLKGTNGESISITVPGTTVRSYSDAIMIYTTGGTSEFFYTNINPANGNSSGNVSITSINTANKTISGTFSFVGYWADEEANLPNIPFTNGTFQNVPYTGDLGGGTTNPEPEEEEVFKAKVDGVVQDYIDNIVVATSGEENNQFISITGVNANSTISISLFSSYSPGTYQIGTGFDEPGANFMNAATGEGYAIDNGTITVTSNTNGVIKGTFSFLVKDDLGATVHTVTEGAFDIMWD